MQSERCQNQISLRILRECLNRHGDVPFAQSINWTVKGVVNEAEISLGCRLRELTCFASCGLFSSKRQSANMNITSALCSSSRDAARCFLASLKSPCSRCSLAKSTSSFADFSFATGPRAFFLLVLPISVTGIEPEWISDPRKS